MLFKVNKKTSSYLHINLNKDSDEVSLRQFLKKYNPAPADWIIII